MPFLIMITLGTLLIASAAIFFSVLGLVQTFSETALYWGTAIEVSKLVLASFVYRYWDELKSLNKVLGVFFIGLLMVITSMGISGHILSSMQQSDLELTSQQIEVQSLDNRISRAEERISFIDQRIATDQERLQAINDDIARVPDDFVTARRQLIQERTPERNEIQERIDTLLDERETLFNELDGMELQRSQLSLETEQIEVKVGPIAKIVETFGADGEKTIYIFILIIVLSFDPVAVYLTVAANRVAIDIRKKKEDKQKEEKLQAIETEQEEHQEDNTISKEDLDNAINEMKSASKQDDSNSETLNEISQALTILQQKLQKDDEKKRQVRDSLS